MLAFSVSLTLIVLLCFVKLNTSKFYGHMTFRIKYITFGTSTAEKWKHSIRYLTLLLSTKELRGSTKELRFGNPLRFSSHNSDLGMKELLPLSGWYKYTEKYIQLHRCDVYVGNENVVGWFCSGNMCEIIGQEDARIVLTRKELIVNFFAILYFMNYNPSFH